MTFVDGSHVQPGAGGPMQVGGQRLALNAPVGHCQVPATQSAAGGTPVSFAQS